MSQPACHLYALIARERRVGVIFRRGPTKQVLLIRWTLESDRFEIGQWLKGRIFVRRCDLSPDGQKLVYFAMDYRRPVGCWTAVSKPPYLTALAFWPKGNSYGGGGLFDGKRQCSHGGVSFVARCSLTRTTSQTAHYSLPAEKIGGSVRKTAGSGAVGASVPLNSRDRP
ncbi:MAG: hypothetical protein ACR2PO_02480 [Methyloligellaceae bacterium]